MLRLKLLLTLMLPPFQSQFPFQLLFQIARLLVTGTQLTPSRKHAGGGVAWAYDERSVGGQEFAVAGDKLQSSARSLRKRKCRRQAIDKPRVAEQPPG